MSSSFNPSLCFWDVPAALLGFAAATALSQIPVISGYGLLWLGGPVAVVALRRVLLPKLTPTLVTTLAPITFARRLLAYAFMFTGGVIALISGGILYAAATAPDHSEFIWPLLVTSIVGGMIAALGVRWMTV